jgi:uncharacterized pyridoxal phosphate-containing UPF0001 family protein
MVITFTDNQDQVKKEFSQLKSIYDKLQSENWKLQRIHLLSMGMSIYKLAIEGKADGSHRK